MDHESRSFFALLEKDLSPDFDIDVDTGTAGTLGPRLAVTLELLLRPGLARSMGLSRRLPLSRGSLSTGSYEMLHFSPQCLHSTSEGVPILLAACLPLVVMVMVVLTFMPVHALLLTHGKQLFAFRAEEAHGATVERDEAFFQPVSFGDEAVHVSQSSLVQRQEET